MLRLLWGEGKGQRGELGGREREKGETHGSEVGTDDEVPDGPDLLGEGVGETDEAVGRVEAREGGSDGKRKASEGNHLRVRVGWRL